MPYLAAPGDPPGPVAVTLQIPGAVPANAPPPPGQVTGHAVANTATPIVAIPVAQGPPRAINSLSPSAPLAYTGAPLAMEAGASLGLLLVGTLSVLAARRARSRPRPGSARS